MTILRLTKEINSFLWENFLIILLVGTGVYFSFLLRFVQIRKFKSALKRITGNFSLNGKKADGDGMSSFQALATAIAAQVGTGNLAGAATAIIAGGPGAIFWMWVSAFFGMSTIYAEAILGQLYKKHVNNQVTGGPAYYISEAFKNKKISSILAKFFAIMCVLALGFIGNAVQSNAISDAFLGSFGIPRIIVGGVVAILAGLVFFGGIKRIASVTEKVVPIMAGLYIFACLIIIILNIKELPGVISIIFYSAFNPKAALGGAIGITVKQSMRYGIARGLFSNEAGMGSTPHAHAIAKVNKASEQGEVALITVFIDTFVVLTGTAIVILLSGIGQGKGINLTQYAFEKVLTGFGGTFIAIALLFFAFSTIIGWYFFGESNIRYLFKTPKAINIYRILVMVMIIFGSMVKVDLIWELADIFNGLMVLPNLLALIALSGIVKNNQD